MKTFGVFIVVVAIFVVAIFAGIIICKDVFQAKSDYSYPLRQVDVLYDANGNILQQTIYNEKTGEYFLKEFIYARQDNKWICVDQKTSVIHVPNDDNIDSTPVYNNMLNIYYNADLENGPIVILNKEGVRVSITKYLAKDLWYEFGYELKIENNTKKVITIAIDDAAIMDVSCKPLFTIDHIDAGKTAYFTMGWDKETLDRCHVPYIDNIEFMIRAFDNANWQSTALTGEKIMLKK